ncbi:hypothetical protein [Treponema sp.]|uniref:hypothetical protein n=1 Tax=Treponema sp. TaxID=166 RepID=UPI003FA23117
MKELETILTACTQKAFYHEKMIKLETEKLTKAIQKTYPNIHPSWIGCGGEGFIFNSDDDCLLELRTLQDLINYAKKTRT